jgi:hypothetical protein
MLTKTEVELNVHRESIRGSNRQIRSDAIEQIRFNWLRTGINCLLGGGGGWGLHLCCTSAPAGACTCVVLAGGFLSSDKQLQTSAHGCKVWQVPPEHH